MSKKKEYIWYCPRIDCNNILLKTKFPYIDGSKFIVCNKCKYTWYGSEIMILNKKTVERARKEIMHKKCG